MELAALATPILLVTAVGAASLAAPRRNEVLMTLVFPLAALALFAHRVSRAASVPTATTPVANVVKSRGPRGFRSLRTAHLSR